MAYPTLSKNWIFRVNQQYPSLGNGPDDCKQSIWALKNELVSTSGWTDADGVAATQNNPFSVMRSSDYSTVSNGDLWDDYTDIHAEDNLPHSWCVLNHPVFNPPTVSLDGGSPGLAFLIEADGYNSSTYQIVTVHASIHGYDASTGTTSVIPSPIGPADGSNGKAASETLIDYIDMMGARTATAYDSVFHTMCTTDGHSWRLIACRSGVPYLMLAVDTLANQQGNVDVSERAYCRHGYVITAIAHGGRINNDNFLHGTYHCAQARDAVAGTWQSIKTYGTALWTIDSNVIDRAGGQISDITGNWHIDEVQMHGAQYACRGYMGNIQDLWCVSDSIADGSTMNSGAFIVLGGMLLPWNKSTPVMA